MLCTAMHTIKEQSLLCNRLKCRSGYDIIISLHMQCYTYCWLLICSINLTEDILCISASLIFMLVNATDRPFFSYFPSTQLSRLKRQSVKKVKMILYLQSKRTLNDLEVYMRYSQLQDDWEGCC